MKIQQEQAFEREKIRVPGAVPAELDLLAGCWTAPGSASKLPSLRAGRWFVADGPFLPADFGYLPAADLVRSAPVDFAHSPAVDLVSVASQPEPVLAAAWFASIAQFFAGRSVAIRARPDSD